LCATIDCIPVGTALVPANYRSLPTNTGWQSCALSGSMGLDSGGGGGSGFCRDVGACAVGLAQGAAVGIYIVEIAEGDSLETGDVQEE